MAVREFRGGPTGFVRVLDSATIGWADFRGNLQYISTGNIGGDDRVAIIAMDYARRRRLEDLRARPDRDRRRGSGVDPALGDTGYDAVVERAVIVSVDAFDWNSPQHITPRFTVEELEPVLTDLRRRLTVLEEENTALKAKLRSGR